MSKAKVAGPSSRAVLTSASGKIPVPKSTTGVEAVEKGEKTGKGENSKSALKVAISKVLPVKSGKVGPAPPQGKEPPPGKQAKQASSAKQLPGKQQAGKQLATGKESPADKQAPPSDKQAPPPNKRQQCNPKPDPSWPKPKLPKPRPKYVAPLPQNTRKWIPPYLLPKPPKPPVYEPPPFTPTHRWIPPYKRKKPPPPAKYEPPPLPPAKHHWIPPDQQKKKPKPSPKYTPPPPGKTLPVKNSAVPKGWGHFVFYRGLKKPACLVGDFSQDSMRFKGSAGLQGIANCVVCCAFVEMVKKIRKFDKPMINQILNSGNHYYEESLRYRACKYDEMNLSKLLPYFFAKRLKVLVEIETHLTITKELKDCGKHETLKSIIFNYLTGDRFWGVFEIAGKTFAIFKGQTPEEKKLLFYFDPTDHTKEGQPLNVRPRGGGYAALIMTHQRTLLIEDIIQNLPKFDKTLVKITPVRVSKYGDIQYCPPEKIEDIALKDLPKSNECKKYEEDSEDEEKKKALEKAKKEESEEAALKTKAALEVNPLALEVAERPSYLKDVDIEKSIKQLEEQKLLLGDKLALESVKPKPISRYVDVIPNRIKILRGRTHQTDRKFTKYEGKQSFGNMISCFTMLRFYKARRWNPKVVMDIMDYGEDYYNVARASKPVGFQFRLAHFPKVHEMNRVKFYLEVEESVGFGQLNSDEYEILDLHACLQNFFINNTCGVLHGPILVAVWIEDGLFYMFDPNERDAKGRRILDADEERENGVACVLVFTVLQDLCDLYLKNVKREERKDFFSISSIKILNDPNIPPNWYSFEGFRKNRWILRADFSQNDARFEIPGRNTQCTAMAAMCLMYSIVDGNMTKWTKDTLNEVLIEGDKFYRDCLEEIRRSRPNFDHEMLCADELMKRRQFKELNKEVALNVTCPILGLLKMEEKIQGIYDFKSGILKFFEDFTHGLCTSGNISICFWKSSPREYYYFDSHSRNNQGLVAPGGRACIIRTNNPEELSSIMLSNIPPTLSGEYNLYELGLKVLEIEKEVPRPERNFYKPITEEDGDFIVIIRGQFSNASEKFILSMLKQGIPMNLIALAYNILKPAAIWNSTDIDLILDRGDAFYIDCYENRQDLEQETIDIVNVKKEFVVGYNKFLVDYETVFEGTLDNIFIEFMANFFKEAPTEDYPRMELIFETPCNSVAIFRDQTGFYLFDSFPRDQYGKYFRAYLDHEDDDVPPRLVQEDTGAGDAIVQEIVQEIVQGAPQAGGDQPPEPTMFTEVPEEETFTVQKFFASRADRNWTLTEGPPRKQHTKQTLLDFSRVNGRACCLRFLMVQDLIMHLYKLYTPWKRIALECKLFKIKLIPEIALVEKLRPEAGERFTSIYDGDWYSFKEISRGFWALNSTIRLDEDIFQEKNRGKQEIPVVVTMLQYCFLYPALARWKDATLDKIISYGDRIYTKIKKEQFQNLKANTSLRDEDIETIVVDSPVTLDNIYKKVKITTHFVTCRISLYASGHILSKEEEPIEQQAPPSVPAPPKPASSEGVTDNVEGVKEVKPEVEGDEEEEKIEEPKTMTIKQGLASFFEKNKYGLLQCNGLLVAIFKGSTVFYMFDPNERGPDGRRDYCGTPCLTRYLDLDKLREVFMSNIDPFGNNFFDIYKVDLREFKTRDKDALEARQPILPEKPGESVIPGSNLLGGWKKINGNKFILRGTLENELYTKVKAPAFVMVAIAMSVIHKPSTWTYPILTEIAELADLVFQQSRKEDDEEFNLDTHPLRLCDVKNTLEIGSTKCHIVLRYPSITGEFNPKNLKIKNLRGCLDELFETNTHGIVEASGEIFAVWEETDPVTEKKEIYLYDPVSRSPIGMPISFGGKPCTVHFVHDTFIVAEHIRMIVQGEGKAMGNVSVTAAEPIVGGLRKKKKNKYGTIKEQLEKCQMGRNKNELNKIMKMNEQELKRKQEHYIQNLGRHAYHCTDPGEILRSYLALDNPKYADNARGNQDLVCSIIACVLFKLEYIDFWSATTLDLIMDTATQIYIDSYICYEPDNRKLGLKNILRRFYVKDEYIKLTVYEPFPAVPLSHQALCLNLQQYFIDEKFGTDEQKFVLMKSGDYWFAVFFTKMTYYLYEPHSTNHKAELDPSGTSVIYRFKKVEDLASRFMLNYEQLTNRFRLCHLKIQLSKKEETKNICDRNQYG